jgi:hypothetical protein
MSNTPNPHNCTELKEHVYFVTSQAGFRKALRLMLSKGDLVYSNTEYKPNYPTAYPCVVELTVNQVFPEYKKDEVVVTCFSEDDYFDRLSDEIDVIRLTRINLEQASKQYKESTS